jgi:hypothetical protein
MKNINIQRKYKHAFKETARQNPYRSSSKPKNSPFCVICRSVSVRGRWLSPQQFEKLGKPIEAQEESKCPACRQKEDQFALGVVELRGETWKENSESVLNNIRNTEAIARYRNDQERILWLKELKTMTKVYVALPELARQIGRELEKSFQGYVEYSHSSEEPYLRVRWWSDLPHMKHRPGHSLKSVLGSKGGAAERLRGHKSRAFRARSGD